MTRINLTSYDYLRISNMASNASMFGRAPYFLRRHIVHGRVRCTLQWIFAKFQALFIQPTILPYFVTFCPFRRTSYAYSLPKNPPRGALGEPGLPTPPENLWLG